MADNVKTMDVEKEEVTATEETERTRECRCFVPRADIYEVDDQIVIVADVPGVDENSVEIMLEKNILTINAYVDPVEMEALPRLLPSTKWAITSAASSSRMRSTARRSRPRSKTACCVCTFPRLAPPWPARSVSKQAKRDLLHS